VKRFFLVFGLLVSGCGEDGAAAGDGTGGSGAADPGLGGGTSSMATTTSTGTAGGDASLGPHLCPAPDAGVAVGFDVGDRLGALTVLDCDGNEVSLDAFCGARALWIFAAHGWCPLCQNVSENQEAVHDDYADQGLVSINVVVATGASETPTESYCALWRETHGHQDVYTFFDPTGEVLALWPGGSSSLSAFIGPDRTILSKLEHVSTESTIRTEIEEALAAP
jgi:hypothetical protein